MISAALVGAFAAPPSAFAVEGGGANPPQPPPPPTGGASGGRDGVITAWARRITFSGEGYSPGFKGNSAVTASIPPCWYTPTWSAAELAMYLTLYTRGWLQPPFGSGRPSPYPAFPADMHTGDLTGMFWAPVCSEGFSSDDADTNAWIDAHWRRFYIWVTDGKPEEALTEKALSEAALKKMRLPALPVSSSPNAGGGDASFVGLPTWLWSDDPRWSVGVPITAAVEGMSVTVTAKPRLLLIDPGTTSSRATVHAGSTYKGRPGCSELRPYAGAATAVPPCGVTYRQSTADVGAAYQIATSVVWDISWSSNGQPQGPVADYPTMVTDNVPIPVTVREVQTAVTAAG